MKTKHYQSKLSFRLLFFARNYLLLILLLAFAEHVIAQNFHLVKDLNTSTDSNPANYNNNISDYSKGNSFANLNGIMFFSADDGVHGKGLWRSDGTTAGTYQIKDSVDPNSIIVSNGKIFFAGAAPLGLWVSDGTALGTVPVLSVGWNDSPNPSNDPGPFGREMLLGETPLLSAPHARPHTKRAAVVEMRASVFMQLSALWWPTRCRQFPE